MSLYSERVRLNVLEVKGLPLCSKRIEPGTFGTLVEKHLWHDSLNGMQARCCCEEMAFAILKFGIFATFLMFRFLSRSLLMGLGQLGHVTFTTDFL